MDPCSKLPTFWRHQMHKMKYIELHDVLIPIKFKPTRSFSVTVEVSDIATVRGVQ